MTKISRSWKWFRHLYTGTRSAWNSSPELTIMYGLICEAGIQSEDCGMRKLILMKSLHWEEPWRINRWLTYNPTLPLCKFSLISFLKEMNFPLPHYFSENLPHTSVKYFLVRIKATKFLPWIFKINKFLKIILQGAECNLLPVAPITNSTSHTEGQLSNCKHQKLSNPLLFFMQTLTATTLLSLT